MFCKFVIGLRREDKNPWEARVPIIPEHVKCLINDHNIEVLVQKSDLRAIKEKEFIRVGAKIVEDLSPCTTIFAVKEIPVEFLQKGKTYVFFSHTIKAGLPACIRQSPAATLADKSATTIRLRNLRGGTNENKKSSSIVGGTCSIFCISVSQLFIQR